LQGLFLLEKNFGSSYSDWQQRTKTDVFVNEPIGAIIRADSAVQLTKEREQENGEQNGVY